MSEKKVVHASAAGFRRSACGKDVDLDVEDMVTFEPEKVTCSACRAVHTARLAWRRVKDLREEIERAIEEARVEDKVMHCLCDEVERVAEAKK